MQASLKLCEKAKAKARTFTPRRAAKASATARKPPVAPTRATPRRSYSDNGGTMSPLRGFLVEGEAGTAEEVEASRDHGGDRAFTGHSSDSASSDTPPGGSPRSADHSEGAPVSDSATNANLPAVSHQPSPHQAPPRKNTQFSTHNFVRSLEHSGIERNVAKTLMQVVRDKLIAEDTKSSAELLNKKDMENHAYLYTAALGEIKTGLQVKSRNDSVILKSLTASLQRETEALDQKMKDDMHKLGNDIKLDMNNRKEEANQDLKSLDMSIMDLNSKFTITIGELRTEVETTKWISTRRFMLAIMAVAITVVGYVSASNSSKASKTVALPTAEDLGVTSSDEDQSYSLR